MLLIKGEKTGATVREREVHGREEAGSAERGNKEGLREGRPKREGSKRGATERSTGIGLSIPKGPCISLFLHFVHPIHLSLSHTLSVALPLVLLATVEGVYVCLCASKKHVSEVTQTE